MTKTRTQRSSNGGDGREPSPSGLPPLVAMAAIAAMVIMAGLARCLHQDGILPGEVQASLTVIGLSSRCAAKADIMV